MEKWGQDSAIVLLSGTMLYKEKLSFLPFLFSVDHPDNIKVNLATAGCRSSSGLLETVTVSLGNLCSSKSRGQGVNSKAQGLGITPV